MIVFSSAIAGSIVTFLHPAKSDQPSVMSTNTKLRHIIFTAETHNFPTGKIQLHVDIS